MIAVCKHCWAEGKATTTFIESGWTAMHWEVIPAAHDDGTWEWENSGESENFWDAVKTDAFYCTPAGSMFLEDDAHEAPTMEELVMVVTDEEVEAPA